jgi:hypothetical protein
MRLLLAPAVLCVLAAAPALGDSGVYTSSRRETAIYNRALQEVQHRHPSCRKAISPRRPDTHAAPGADLLGALGVLRRPQNDGDRTFGTQFRDPLLRGAGVFLDYVRLARVVDGTSFFLVPVQDTRSFPHPPLYCFTLDRHQIDRDLASLPPRRRRVYARHLHRILGYQIHLAHHKAKQGVWLISRGQGGGSGAAYTASQVLRGAPLGGEWSPGHPATVSGVVPDGVASITAIYKARTARVPVLPTRPTRHPRVRLRRVHAPAQTVDAPVVENVVAFTVHRPGELSQPDLIQWRDGAGNVTRQIHRAAH